MADEEAKRTVKTVAPDGEAFRFVWFLVKKSWWESMIRSVPLGDLPCPHCGERVMVLRAENDGIALDRR